MSKDSKIVKIGVIGAGAIFRDRHLPNLAAIAGVELVAVCNRSESSSKNIAEQFGFTATETDWRKLIARDDLDAVMIGTWPYTHAEMSVAALEAGKHVFCQARMAATLDEARAMADAAAKHPTLINHICPPPHRVPFEPYIKHCLENQTLGELREVRLACIDGSNLGPLHWRERTEYSGIQIMQLGIWAETLIAILGEYETLIAHTATPIETKTDEQDQAYTINIPQHVAIAGTLQSGVTITELHTGLAAGEAINQLTLVGSQATLRHDIASNALSISRGDKPFELVSVPDELLRPWHVEDDFIQAVRTGEQVGINPDFATGLKYMRKVQAVHQSAAEGRRVQLAEV